MQRSLASLALDPEVCVHLLLGAKLLLPLNVNLLLLGLTVAANAVIRVLKEVLAPEALLLDDREFSQT